MTREPQTNLEFLKNFTGNDSARMRKYITMFLAAAPDDASAISNAMRENNLEALRASAHSLRPQLSYMGIKNGEHLLKQMEEIVRSTMGTERLPAMVEEFSAIFGQACEELQTYLNTTV